jgi:UDP-2,4-diacetamido-2,4,6-trideoxy-beta-L-altropyranose hydrolase
MTAPRFAIRTDAGAEIGLGHLRRCLALARALRAAGADASFFVDGDASPADGAGFEVRRVAAGRDLADVCESAGRAGARAVVVDSYVVGAPYLRGLGEAGFRVVVIDDLADRELEVDLVVNPSPAAVGLRYRAAARTQYLLGSRFALLQPEFAAPPTRRTAERARRLLVTIGGGDVDGFTAAVVGWIAACLDDVTLDVVIGPWFAGAEELRSVAARAGSSIRLHERPHDMRRLMLGADLAISGGGQTTYELAATGTPAIAIEMADNQAASLAALAEAGTLVAVGAAADPDLESALTAELAALVKDRDRRAEMSRRARAAVDGHGARRVAKAVLALGAAA